MGTDTGAVYDPELPDDDHVNGHLNDEVDASEASSGAPPLSATVSFCGSADGNGMIGPPNCSFWRDNLGSSTAAPTGNNALP